MQYFLHSENTVEHHTDFENHTYDDVIFRHTYGEVLHYVALTLSNKKIT